MPTGECRRARYVRVDGDEEQDGAHHRYLCWKLDREWVVAQNAPYSLTPVSPRPQQIAAFVVPLLVIVGWATHHDLTLFFADFEVRGDGYSLLCCYIKLASSDYRSLCSCAPRELPDSVRGLLMTGTYRL